MTTLETQSGLLKAVLTLHPVVSGNLEVLQLKVFLVIYYVPMAPVLGTYVVFCLA